MYDHNILRTYKRGRVRVEISTTYDDNHDLDWLGKGSNRVEYSTFVYDRRERVMRLPDAKCNSRWDSAWRDKHGRIVPDPDAEAPYRDSYGREYAFIIVDPSQVDNVFKYAFQNAERVDAYYRDQWYLFRIWVRLYIDDEEVSFNVIGGFESDTGINSISTARSEIAYSVFDDARKAFPKANGW